MKTKGITTDGKHDFAEARGARTSGHGAEGKHDSCGVFGIYSFVKKDVSYRIYNGLVSIQHRGQDSAGIAILNSSGIRTKKGAGLVAELFSEKDLKGMHGYVGIGHVRYPTTGACVEEDAQPIMVNYPKKGISLVHNGNIANFASEMSSLKGAGRHFASSCDAEVILNRFAQEMIRSKNNIWKAARACMDILDGSYSVILMTGEGELVAFRDPLGIKPLCYAINNKRIVFASESTAIDINNMTISGDVKPGEVFMVRKNKVHRRIVKKSGRRAHCMFEYVYFARQDSLIDGRLVYDVRFRLGETLARKFPAKADMVVAVPDTSKPAALGYSKVSGIPVIEALTKNRYVGRTFIMPDQSKRVSATFLKLNPLKSAIKGKKLVVIDDSIVRGTTIGPIVRMLRKAGAKEVHLRIACPPIVSPCFYGIDLPTYKELAAYKHSIEEIRKMSGADSLEYIPIGGMVNSIGKKGRLCLGCLMDSYPTPVGQRLADEVKNGRYTSNGRCWEKIG